MKTSRFSNLLLPSSILTMLLAGYFLIGRDTHVSGFFLGNLDANINFYTYIGLSIMLAACFKTANLKHAYSLDIAFNATQLIKVIALFIVLFFLERIFSYQYWSNLRIDHEQELWLTSAQSFSTFWKHNGDKFAYFSMWEGLYNKPYVFLLLAIHKLIAIDSWFKYQLVSFGIVIASISLLCILLNRIYGRVAVLFLLLASTCSAYLHFTNYYMKQHIVMVLFFPIVMWFIFAMWEKFSFTKVVLLSIACFAAFVSYVACIFYLPIALIALLFNKNSKMEKLCSLLIVLVPCATYIAFLLTHLQSWPSDYYLGKSIFHEGGGGLFVFLYDFKTQLKVLFIPGGIWGWMIQGCFIAGLIYSCGTLKKEILIWWVALAMAVFAMSSTRDIELGKNFILIVPYLAIASIGAATLWKYHFSKDRFSKFLCALLLLMGLGSELYYSNLSERWQNLQVHGMGAPLNDRIWFFDDAEKLKAHYKQKNSIVVDSSLVNNNFEWAETSLNEGYNFGNTFKELSIYMGANLMKKENKFPNNCESIFLTDKSIEQTQQYLGNEAVVNLLEKYRPSNPRYEHLNYQPDVFHYLYEVKFKNDCLPGMESK